jgi:hypothetical protein
MPIEDRLDRIEKLLTMIWDQVRVTMPTPKAQSQLPEFTLDVVAEQISARHPKQKTQSTDTVGRYLLDIVGSMANPESVASHINRHHEWRCRYEWSTCPANMVPYLGKWLRERACDPCPTDAEGEAMLRQPERMSRTERDLLDMAKEFGR